MIEHDLSAQGRRTRSVLIGMIVSQGVLSRVASRWVGSGLFPEGDKVSNLIGTLCVRYYRDFRKAPGANIGALVEEWSAENPHDVETQQMLRILLESLSGQYERLQEELNVEYTNKIAGKLFRRERIKQVVREVVQLERNGQVDEAETKLLAYKRIELDGCAAVSSLTDEEEIRAAFEQSTKPIVEYGIPSIDRFFQGQLQREAFVAFLAPNKSGKSFWLLDLACRALTQRRRVAFFLIGDMSKAQFHRRLYSRVAVRPQFSPSGEWPCDINMPRAVGMQPRPADSKQPWLAEVQMEARRYKKPIDADRAVVACEKWMSEVVRASEPYFKLSVHGGRTISAMGIRTELDAMEQEGFVPDVVLVDYADNLAPIRKMENVRDQVNETWLSLRTTALENKCLLVTATQCDTPGFGKWVLTKENFSEDRRKLDHVSMMVGLNIGRKDKTMGVTRLNIVNLREGAYEEHRCCYVAGCLAVSNPAVEAVYPWGKMTEEELRRLPEGSAPLGDSEE